MILNPRVEEEENVGKKWKYKELKEEGNYKRGKRRTRREMERWMWAVRGGGE